MNLINLRKSEEGYVLIVVIVIGAVGLLFSTFLLDAATTRASTGYRLGEHSEYYYNVEETHGKVVAWLQNNSKNLVTAFLAADFNTNFDITAPTVGDNEAAFFSVPTMVKMKGTNDSPMLSNNAYFGTATFPTTTNIDTSASFDAAAEFAAADLGGANARVVLVWVRETAGNYEPIFRIDVINGNNPDRGVHSFSYVYSTFESSSIAIGFYGGSSVNLNSKNNTCSSRTWAYSGGSWTYGAEEANCGMVSEGVVTINGDVAGSAYSNTTDGVVIGKHGDVSGAVCEAPGCFSAVAPTVTSAASVCPAGTDLNVNSNTVLGNASTKCYATVDIRNNKNLTLNAYVEDGYEWHFQTLDLANNAHLNFGPVPVGKTLRITVDNIVGNKFNGNQVLNSGNAPHQVEFFYSGSNTLTLNGTADLNMAFNAPNANVNISGDFIFSGAMYANNLNVTGNATLYYDPDSFSAVSSSMVVTDLNFALRKASQRYR